MTRVYKQRTLKRVPIFCLYKGDQFIGTGTKKELAEMIDVKVSTIDFYASPVYHKRAGNSSKRYIVDKIGYEETQGRGR